jgi:hypothetical protein
MKFKKDITEKVCLVVLHGLAAADGIMRIWKGYQKSNKSEYMYENKDENYINVSCL